MRRSRSLVLGWLLAVLLSVQGGLAIAHCLAMMAPGDVICHAAGEESPGPQGGSDATGESCCAACPLPAAGLPPQMPVVRPVAITWVVPVPFVPDGRAGIGATAVTPQQPRAPPAFS